MSSRKATNSRRHRKTDKYKVWRQENKERLAQKNWEYRLMKDYGLTGEQYGQMFIEQCGNCAICGRNQSEFDYKLAVDHCHETGKVRGLLCRPCNQALGLLQEKAEIVSKAADYLRK